LRGLLGEWPGSPEVDGGKWATGSSGRDAAALGDYEASGKSEGQVITVAEAISAGDALEDGLDALLAVLEDDAEAAAPLLGGRLAVSRDSSERRLYGKEKEGRRGFRGVSWTMFMPFDEEDEGCSTADSDRNGLREGRRRRKEGEEGEEEGEEDEQGPAGAVERLRQRQGLVGKDIARGEDGSLFDNRGLSSARGDKEGRCNCGRGSITGVMGVNLVALAVWGVALSYIMQFLYIALSFGSAIAPECFLYFIHSSRDATVP
jgi:hypothetical protein